jgi:hypothetical protein
MAYTSANAGQVGPARGVSLDRALRKLYPSTSKLTFNPLFRAAVNAFDVVPRLIFPEFRSLPPNHLRIRIGVGNRILNNQTHLVARSTSRSCSAGSSAARRVSAIGAPVGALTELSAVHGRRRVGWRAIVRSNPEACPKSPLSRSCTVV